MKLLAIFTSALLLSLGAVAAAPSVAAAQCHWGCACQGDACGCNMYGNGGRCDATASGCVVDGCKGSKVFFAPDGSVARFASLTDDVSASRREWVAEGHEVERTCAGLVLERRITRSEATAMRKRQRSLTI